MCLQKMAICKYALGAVAEALKSMREAVAIFDVTVDRDYPEAQFSRSLLRQMLQGRATLNFAEI